MRKGRTVSIAIETSCRAGGLLLAIGDRRQEVCFDAAGRHTVYLLSHLAAMMKQAKLRPQDIDEVYVSAGPGSFTGLRVGVTVARTLGQAIPHLKCVAVPTPAAVVENARDLDWQHLAVILDARQGCVHATLFNRVNRDRDRRGGAIAPAVLPAGLWSPEEFLAAAPRPLLLTGEGLDYYEMRAPGVSVAPALLRLPTAAGVWAVGSRLAAAGQFTEFHHLLPIYARGPSVTGPAARHEESKTCTDTEI
jgi:tRNA threonylcarbamoyladenosine biosynthesis protein TsaB